MKEACSFWCSKCKFDHPGECVVLEKATTPKLGPYPPNAIMDLASGYRTYIRANGWPYSDLIPDQEITPQPRPLDMPWQTGDIVAVNISGDKFLFKVLEDSTYPWVMILASNKVKASKVGVKDRIARDSFYGECSKVVA